MAHTKFYCNGLKGVFTSGHDIACFLFRGQLFYFYKPCIKDKRDLPDYLLKVWNTISESTQTQITQETYVYLNWKFKGNMFKEIKTLSEVFEEVN